MSNYTVFARKYRPKTFADVLGQEHITRTLRNAIEQNRIAHAYIFVGPRGTGKTSTARIFAKALNCAGGPKADFDPEEEVCREIAEGRSLDVIEFDAASHTGVEKVRDLILDRVNYVPNGRFKIYLVDEVHMLSTGSFNALLKTLEEPPPHVKFLFATTDVQKVPTTILSRCQRFDLKRIPTATIAKHLLFIAKNEGFTLATEAADAVARGAEGGLRDAESMLDQLVAFCGDTIAEADVLSVFGFTSAHTVTALCDAILGADASAALAAIHEQAEAGKDLGRLMTELITHFRNLLVLKADPNGLGDEWMPEAVAVMQEQAERVPMEKVLDLIEQFAGAESRMKWAVNKKMHFEVALIRAIQILQSATLTEVLETLAALRGGHALSPISQPTKPAATPAESRAPAPRAQPAAPASRVAESEPAPAPISKPRAVETPKVAEPPPAPATKIVAKPEPAPAPAPVSNDAFWQALVETVRRDRKLISPWLEAGALIRIDGESVLIGFPPDQAFAKDFLEQGHRGFLGSAASAILGRTVKLTLELRDGIVAKPLPQPVPEAAPDPMETFKSDPLIRKALEIFRAEVQPA
ncbi:MAG: DNA polymerase III subunit gamma/tau [Chthoniobacteraceae bacterium]